MNINKIFTYVLIILTGMIMATLAAYYLLNEFVYPAKEHDIHNESSIKLGGMLEVAE
jgi:hypothetical protein